MNILVPQGIGDSIWALHKVQDLAGQRKEEIHLKVACSVDGGVEARALEFLSRFDFVKSVSMYPMQLVPGAAGIILLPGTPADTEGYYRYISDGPTCELAGIDYVMMPNAPLERGVRLENWLPHLRTNWQVMRHFHFLTEEEAYGEELRGKLGRYVVFQLGSKVANTYAGHNRGPLWHPGDWHALGLEIEKRFGFKIVMVGAEYDRDYVDEVLHPPASWVDLVGKCSIGRTFSVVKRATCAITYQSGIGILASYFGVPTAIFWRPKGDSVSPDYYISFEESMASAWVRPDMLASGKHLPLIYTKCHVTGILEEITRRSWV